jgi:hypothetical protein
MCSPLSVRYGAGAASLHQIADALNARGITTPRGGRWYASSCAMLSKGVSGS